MRSAAGLSPDFSAISGMHVLIALSGGCDSVSLAALLSEHRDRFRLKLSAAHMDHAIRADSAADTEFCRTLCDRLGIPLYTVRADIPAEAAARHEGLESAARRVRHRWLEEVRREIGADRIVLAHHLDDQAETVLMHLARGTGPEGIGAMRECAGTLYRPLLGFHKAELRRYLEARGLGWREDSTNTVGNTPRNAIRLHVMPELEKSYPGFATAAARYARSAQIEDDCLRRMTSAYLNDAFRSTTFAGWLELGARPDRAILRRALRAACPCPLTWEQVNTLEHLANQPKGRLGLTADVLAERTGDRLYFVRKPSPSIRPVPLALVGVTRLDGVCAIEAAAAPPVAIRNETMRQVLRRDALEGAVLRTRMDGDRFRPLGCGDRLLSDFLIDRKVDRPLRDHLGLIAVGSRVLWVCGLGISADAALRGDSDEAVRLSCQYQYPFDIRK